jgi:hypothetical protein
MNLTFVKNLTNLVVTNTAVGCVMDEMATNDNASRNNNTQPTAAIDDHGGVLLMDDKQIKQTAVVITTNWIPSAPSIQMIQEVIDSLEMLKGLPHNAPTYIILDALAGHSHDQVRWDKEETLELYGINLMKEYMHRENFHIIVNNVNLHIGANLNKAIELLNPETEFLYFLQHDFKFIKEINHTAIVKTMKEYPDVFRNIRFGKGINGPKRSGARSDDCWHMKGSAKKRTELPCRGHINGPIIIILLP